MKKIIATSLLSLLLISCSNSISNIQELPENATNQTNTFSSAKSIKINDEEMGGTAKNSAFKQNKLDLESKTKNSILSFKTVQIKKGKVKASEDINSFKVNGIIAYNDDKGNLKSGANITVNLLLDGKSIANAVTAEDGSWLINLDKAKYTGKNLGINFQFINKYWSIGGQGKSYTWEGLPINSINSDLDTGTISPVKDSENAKAAYINDIYNRYLKMFKKEGIDVNSWWKVQLKTIWPQNGNYYSFNTVNLSDADHWDVNGHEIGHAMTDIGTNSNMGGGQHKIDECYSENLAWSEGFATFLSGVVSLEKSDPDARFEFIVPRRAPIREENVPEDVCNGQKNEWRASAAIWDLYDTHQDGQDKLAIPFKTIWNAVSRKDKKIGSIKDLVDSLKVVAPEYNQEVDNVVKFNTMF